MDSYGRNSQNFADHYKNQLVRYQDPDKTVEFRYDPFGRRIQKKVELKNSQSSQITNYYYEGYRVIEERDGSDRVTKQYVYGSGIDEILRMDIYQNQTSTPYYLHHNLIGSITGITDENGNLIELIEYDPYGKPYFLKPTGNPENPYSIQNESTIGNTYLFQGREYDPETGLYYFRARYYDPELGRFLSPDPKGYIDSMNLYQAFNCNPINFIDPFGEFIIKVAFADIIPPTEPQWKYELEFRLQFDFTSPEEIGLNLVKEILEKITEHLTKKAELNTLYYMLKAKGWLKKVFLVKELIELTEQGPTIKTPFREIEDLLKIEKWEQFLGYKMIEIKTDPKIKRLYRKLYGEEESLTTEQAIEFLKIVRKEFPELEEVYPWDELLELAVPEKPDTIVSGQIRFRYKALIGQYREYYLRPSGKNIYYNPTLEEIYEYLKYEWIKKVQRLQMELKR
jgi:RHS repeat-associated protein